MKKQPAKKKPPCNGPGCEKELDHPGLCTAEAAALKPKRGAPKPTEKEAPGEQNPNPKPPPTKRMGGGTPSAVPAKKPNPGAVGEDDEASKAPGEQKICALGHSSCDNQHLKKVTKPNRKRPPPVEGANIAAELTSAAEPEGSAKDDLERLRRKVGAWQKEKFEKLGMTVKSIVPAPPAPPETGESSSAAAAGAEPPPKKARPKKDGVAPGGRGFACPAEGCENFFDTAAEALAHAVELCGFEGNGLASRADGGISRLYDEKGFTCCLWDGCDKLIKASGKRDGVWQLGGAVHAVQSHEARHTKGPPPKAYFACPDPTCSFTSTESSHEVWSHVYVAHPTIPRDLELCLWKGCGARPTHDGLKAHEPIHTGVYPFHCSTCGQGFNHASKRALPPQTRAPLFNACLSPRCIVCRAGKANVCCVVVYKCGCGKEYKGYQAENLKAAHEKKCEQGFTKL